MELRQGQQVSDGITTTQRPLPNGDAIWKKLFVIRSSPFSYSIDFTRHLLLIIFKAFIASPFYLSSGGITRMSRRATRKLRIQMARPPLTLEKSV
jgi:hypothetical protein